MDTVVTAVNFIRSRSLQHRLFQQLCEEMDSEHTRLVYHAKVRWLSRGQVLKRVHELLDEMKAFLQEKGHHLAKEFGESMFTVRLTYLNDIFTYLSDLNTSLQGNKVSIVEAAQSINTMKALLRSWCTGGSENNSYSSFEKLDALIQKSERACSLKKQIKEEVTRHLEILASNFERHFPNLSVKRWMVNPFTVPMDEVDNDIKDDLIIISLEGLFLKGPL